MLGILNCCPRALPHKHDGLVFPLRERLQRGNLVLVVRRRIGYRISRLASRWLADLGRLRPGRGNLLAWYCLLHKRPHIRKDPSFPADSNVQLSGISIIFDG